MSRAAVAPCVVNLSSDSDAEEEEGGISTDSPEEIKGEFLPTCVPLKQWSRLQLSI